MSTILANFWTFIAQIPAGIARQVYYPNQQAGLHWFVQLKPRKVGIKQYIIIYKRLNP